MRGLPGLLSVCLTLGALAGCELYFEQTPDEPPILPVDAPFPPPIDGGFPPIDAPPSNCRVVAYCGEGGRLFRTTCLPGAPAVLPPDVYSTGALFGGCASRACRDSSTFSVCPDGSCDTAQEDLCRPLTTCPVAGSACAGDATATCSEQVGCAVSAVTDTCTCVDGVYACASTAAEVSGMLVGNWFASVTPPPFTEPYRGTLTFNNNRTYEAQRAGADALFYYGEDGGSDVFRWRPVGTTATGGVATLDIYFGTHSIQTALITDIRRDGTRTTFTFWDSWLDCTRPFRFDAAPVTP